MGHTIVLEVPENLYEAIRSEAVKHGQTPDKLAAQWLDEAVRRVQSAEQDPLIRLFGTIQADVANVAEQHDRYISQSLFRELRDGE